MSSEKFCLRWNDFESNISVAFRELRDDKDFFDVTLACDDEQISAHKVILSACSPFFRNILRRNPHQHPLLYLKGVKYTDLQSVLNFMYHGEVNVAQEELNSFLAVAEDLRVKGLTQNQGGSQHSQAKRSKSPPVLKPTPRPIVEREPAPLPKRPRPAPPSLSNSYVQDDDDIQEVVPVKTEPREPLPPPPQPMATYSPTIPTPSPIIAPQPTSQTHAVAPMEDSMAQYEEQYEDYGQYEDQSYAGGLDPSMTGAEGNKGGEFTPQRPEDLDQFIGRGELGYNCEICAQFGHASKSNVRNHVESKHFPNTFVYNCNICNKTCNSRQALQQHKSKKCAKKLKNLSY
eukprot:GFUD01040614.1.p1 GENE.GFUD01040614.1~~GFUD01040614.1.p1  ORF type:complete len:393 (+),score=68.12 GFUD01040614.1:147-1181(+)